jgi:hypothetical protein
MTHVTLFGLNSHKIRQLFILGMVGMSMMLGMFFLTQVSRGAETLTINVIPPEAGDFWTYKVDQNALFGSGGSSSYKRKETFLESDEVNITSFNHTLACYKLESHQERDYEYEDNSLYYNYRDQQNYLYWKEVSQINFSNGDMLFTYEYSYDDPVAIFPLTETTDVLLTGNFSWTRIDWLSNGTVQQHYNSSTFNISIHAIEIGQKTIDIGTFTTLKVEEVWYFGQFHTTMENYYTVQFGQYPIYRKIVELNSTGTPLYEIDEELINYHGYVEKIPGFPIGWVIGLAFVPIGCIIFQFRKNK